MGLKFSNIMYVHYDIYANYSSSQHKFVLTREPNSLYSKYLNTMQ